LKRDSGKTWDANEQIWPSVEYLMRNKGAGDPTGDISAQ